MKYRSMTKGLRFIGVASLAAAGAMFSHAQVPSIIPAPLSAVESSGTMQISDGDIVSYSAGDPPMQFAARHFIDLMKQTRGITLHARVGAEKSAAITLMRLPAGNVEKMSRIALFQTSRPASKPSSS